MGGLPRGARVELEPVAFSLQQPLVRDPVSWGPAGKQHGADLEPRDNDEDAAEARQWVTAIQHGTRDWTHESPSGRVESCAEFLLSPSYFLRVHVSIAPPGEAPSLESGPSASIMQHPEPPGAAWVEGVSQTTWHHVSSLLEQARLGVECVVEATAYYNVKVLSSDEVGIALTAGAPEGLAFSVPCVPTLGIGSNPSVNAAYQLQLMASAL